MEDAAAAVREWREAKCAEYCHRCPNNCCVGRLNPRLDDLGPFQELPRVRKRDDPRPREGPYLVDRRHLFGGSCWLVGRCPHLQEGRCAIYDHPGRPRDCHEYPVHVQRVLGGFVVNAERSCWIFQQPGNCEEIERLAAQLGTECILHEDEVKS